MEKEKSLFQLVFPLIAAAVALFALSTFIGSYASEHISLSSYTQKESKITDWHFYWGDSEESLQNVDKWKISDKKTPVRRLGNKRYVRLNYTVPPSDADKLLSFFTDFSPVRVLVDENEVYNNGTLNSYVGNRVNRIILKASSLPQTVDIYLYVPMSFSFSSYLSELEVSFDLNSVGDMSGIIISSVILIIGIFLILISLIFSVHNKKMGTMVLLGILVFVAGSWNIFYQLSSHIATFADPLMFRLQLFLRLITGLGVVMVALLNFRKWSAISKICSSVLLLLSVFVIFAPNFIFLKILFCLFIVFYVVLFADILTKLIRCINEKLPFSRSSLLFLMFFVFIFLFDIIGVFYYSAITVPELETVSVVIYAVSMFISALKNVIYVNIRAEERVNQVSKDTEWISRIMSLTSVIFTQKDEESFISSTADGICELINSSFSAENYANGPYSELKKSDVKYSAAVKKPKSYKEIKNAGGILSCNYDGIEERYNKSHEKSVYYGKNYLDIIFMTSERIIGIIHFENVNSGFSENLKNFIDIAYSNISVVLSNLELRQDMVMTQENVFTDIADIAEKRSGETGRHMNRVADLTKCICSAMGLSKKEISLISSASRVHDIGKLAIPDSIITKNGKLTDDEFDVMKEHVVFGYNMLSKSPGEFMNAAAVIAQQHHENYDGTGYLGMAGNEIHLYARIVKVADVYDALMNSRSYKESWNENKVFEFIKERSGKDFDPQVVEAMNLCRNELIKIKE